MLHDYEFEAAGFGMQLLRDAGITHLDQWYSDFVETDWRYVEGYYETDQLPDWKTCVVSGCPLIAPRPIPPLAHRQVEVRFAVLIRDVSCDQAIALISQVVVSELRKTL